MGVPNEQSTPLFANHRDLCRYSGKADGNYQLVVKALQRTAMDIMAERGTGTTSLSTDHCG
jgi:hypothetical protein